MTKEEKFRLSEENERKHFKKWAKKMNITDYEVSPVGSMAPYDAIYKWNNQWFVVDVKVSNINSDTLYPTAIKGGIGGHLIKRHKFEGLYDIYMNTPKIETFNRIEFSLCMLPTFMIFFNDVVAIWHLTREGLLWDNINKKFMENNKFITVKDKSTTMGDQKDAYNDYYKKGLQIKDAYLIKI
jgi:hypothetical protein